jgi:hypothetical protein
MRGAIPLLPQYAFMARYSIQSKGQLYFYLYLYTIKVFATSNHHVMKIYGRIEVNPHAFLN